MKKLIRWMIALGLCLALCVCGALAAEGDITVQLDGQSLAFTDAVPQLRNQRTYLPFRAVFEAMGAEVGYDSGVVTATRDGKTLTMTIGSTQATVEENGVKRPIQMDVAPYLDASISRTYIPVRFAAQAFDCVVGWDQAARTAIIIDAEKVVDAAREGKSYTYLEKLAAVNEKYNAGLWDLNATFNGEASMFTAPLFTMNGQVDGTVQDGEKMSMDMDMKMDLSGLTGMVSADQAMQDALKTDSADLTVRGDLNSGKLYLNMDMGALGTKAGVDPDAWYEMDAAALTAQSGMNVAGSDDMLDTLVSFLTAVEPTNSATAYADFKADMEALLAAFSDEGFQAKDNGTYTATYNGVPAGNSTADLYITVLPDGGGLGEWEFGFATIQSGQASVSMSVIARMTADGKMTAEVKAVIGLIITAKLTMEGSFTPGTTAPVTAPPDGAKVLPFDQLTRQGVGVIGGGDGPTTLVGSPS